MTLALSRSPLLAGYIEMLRIRRIEEGIADRYAEQEMRCPVHLSIGQEAVAVGVCSHLRPTDYLMSTHRAHAHYLAKGGNLRGLLAEIYGRSTGCASGRGGSMHLIDLSAGILGATPIVGSTLPLAVGAAFGSWMKNEQRVTVVFFGEGTTEEGVFSEALNFAALKALPILFVCENNLYSVYSPLSVRQPEGRNRCEIARAHGVPAESGDGNAFTEVSELSAKAISAIRQGQGPRYLEFATYRWREHCGPHYDNHIGYRTEAEFLTWRERDPIATLRRSLCDQVQLDSNDESEIEETIAQEIAEAFSFAHSSPQPDPASSAAHTYAESEY